MKKIKDLSVLHSFIDNVWVFELERPVKFQTAQIRRKHKIKLPDAILAATTLVHDLTLPTSDIADFNHIIDLQIVNPNDR